MLKPLFLLSCLFACISAQAQLSKMDPADTNAIYWRDAKYYGPVRSVASTWVNVKDTALQAPNGTEYIYFNKNRRVTEYFLVNSLADTVLITKPTYNEYGHPILENVLKTNGNLNNLIINEFQEEGTKKSTEYSYSGDLSSVTEYNYRGDTTVIVKRYFNTRTLQLNEESAVRAEVIYKNGRVVKTTVTEGGTLVYEDTCEYKAVDKYGNWTALKANVGILWDHKWEDAVVLTTRKIDYFND